MPSHKCSRNRRQIHPVTCYPEHDGLQYTRFLLRLAQSSMWAATSATNPESRRGEHSGWLEIGSAEGGGNRNGRGSNKAVSYIGRDKRTMPTTTRFAEALLGLWKASEGLGSTALEFHRLLRPVTRAAPSHERRRAEA